MTVEGRAARVVILETQLKQYRRQLFIDLADTLRERDIELTIVYSDPNRRERAKADTTELERGIGVKIPIYWLLGDRLVVQRAWDAVRDADLVILERGSKLLFNYVLVAMSQLGRKRIAFWAHAYNHQARRPSASEWLKRKLVTKTDWWFAYTEGEARYLAAHGVPGDAISVLHNTIDTRELTDAIRALPEETRRRTRDSLGIAAHAAVGLYCGSLYRDKHLPFLVDAIRRVRERVPTFEMVIVGDGPERPIVEAAARQLPFVHYVGPLFGRERAPFFAVSDVFLMPGLVGLAIVDAFAAALPVVTTDIPIHSPEIEYLQPDVNGIISPYDARPFAADIAQLLQDVPRLQRMKQAARATADTLPLARMVAEFADGIVRCLEAGGR